MHVRSLVIGYSFLTAFSIAAVFIFWIDILVSIWATILWYSIILYIIYFIWKKIRYGKAMGYLHFFSFYLYKITLTLCIIVIWGWAFIAYHNILVPATLPYYKISNGEQTLHFQTMSHIASQSFYTYVRDDIFKAKKDGFVLYFEGVRPGSEENMNKFNSALGVELEPGTYDKLSELYGIVAQDNSYFLWLVNNKDYNIDLSIDEIIEIYEAKKELSATSDRNLLWSGSVLSSEMQNIDAYINDMSEREISFLRYINQAFMNMIIKNESIRTIIMKAVWNEDIFTVILDDRNAHLVKSINDNPKKDIFIIYGLMHFDGVYELLKQSDSRWEIQESWEYRVIESALK